MRIFFWDDDERQRALGPTEVINLSIIASMIRESNEADLVILLTDYEYPSGGFFGIASGEGRPDYGYAIVTLGSLGRLVFPHELGHLFLAQHEIDAHFRRVPKPELCDHAWEMRPNLGTLMFSQGGSFGNTGIIKRRVLRFSDPDACYSIYRAGRIFEEDYQGSCIEYIRKDYTANNTAVVRASGCSISQLRGSNTEYAALINGNNQLCSDPEVYTADITPNDPQAIYEWYVTYDGFLPDEDERISIGENTDTVLIPKSIADGCSFFFLHVIVRYSDQSTTAEATKRISTNCSPFPCDYDPVAIANR